MTEKPQEVSAPVHNTEHVNELIAAVRNERSARQAYADRDMAGGAHWEVVKQAGLRVDAALAKIDAASSAGSPRGR